MALIKDIDDLLLAIQQGKSFEYLYFWGHQAGKVINKSCLSQWYPAQFSVDGTNYLTVEHYMMAEKARLFEDELALQRILAAQMPAQAKALGRKIDNFDETLWNKQRIEIVVKGNFEKFSQNPPLRDFLQQTAEHILIEASPVDRIWGIGLAENDPRARYAEQWQGLNLLGFALMQVREQL